jgi:tetratricopeptide (TPR) repeat protein
VEVLKMCWTKARLTIAIGLAQLLVGGIVATSPSMATDLNEQLSIQLYNGTQSRQRTEADRLVRLGEQQQRAGFPDKAIASWLQALELYRVVKEIEAQATVYEALAEAYSRTGRFAEAEDAFRRRLAIARDLQDFRGQVYGFNNVGAILLRRGSISEAQKAFSDGLKVARDIRFRAGEGLSLSNLGLVAYSLGNYNRAIQYYEQGRTLRGQANDPGEANTLNNLGDAYRAIRDYRSALVSYRQALFVAQNSLDRPNQFRSLEGLTRAFYGLGQNSNASEALDQRLALALEQNNSKQVLSVLKDLGQYYRAKGDLPAADSYYQQALAVAKVLNDEREQQGLMAQIGELRSRKYTQ